MTSNNVPTTIRDLIDRMADSQPDRAFLISPSGDRVVTFEDLRRRSYSLFARFRQMDLNKGDKIALLMDNGLFTTQLFLATMYSGYVAVPLNVRAGTYQLSYTLDHCDAEILFAGAEYGGLADEMMVRIERPIKVIRADEDDGFGDDDISSVAFPPPPPAAEDPALLMYTSGSTGQPKGALHTHRSVLAHGGNSALSHQLTEADRSLVGLPLHHINAECVNLIPTLVSGGSVVVPRHFAVSEFCDDMADRGCTWSLRNAQPFRHLKLALVQRRPAADHTHERQHPNTLVRFCPTHPPSCPVERPSPVGRVLSERDMSRVSNSLWGSYCRTPI